MKKPKYMSTRELYRRIKTARHLIASEKCKRYPRDWYIVRLLGKVETYSNIIESRDGECVA